MKNNDRTLTEKLNKHNLIGTCIKLPIKIDIEKCLSEVKSIPKELWNEERSSVHDDVKAIFLRGYPPIQNKPDADRDVLGSLPYLNEIIKKTIPGSICKALLAELSSNGIIPMHRDGHKLPGVDNSPITQYFSETIRFHLPIITNDQVNFFCNGDFFNMKSGEIWAINNLSDHGVLNQHPTQSRTHLVFDILPNIETYEFLQCAERPVGSRNYKLVEHLMKNSKAPEESPYAKGKSVPV